MRSILAGENRGKLQDVNLVIEAAGDVARRVAIEIVEMRARRAIKEVFST